MIRGAKRRRKPLSFNAILTSKSHNRGMHLVAKRDPIAAFNERAQSAGWTFTCGPAQGFEHQQLAGALALWRKKAAGRRMPERSDMTARDMKAFLSHMSLIERVGNSRSATYRVRLHGSTLASYGGDMTGRFLEQVVPEQFVGCYAGIYDVVLELLAPVRVTSQFQAPRVDYLDGESLVAPLSVHGKDTPLILSVTYAEPRVAPRES